jgi:hypothetical protein
VYVGLNFLETLLGLRGMPHFGGGGGGGPTAQQQALSTEQATANAKLNLQENEQRKVILNAMQGTRVFRGSALSRAVAGNSAGTENATPPGAPSAAQSGGALRTAAAGNSLLDQFGAPTGIAAQAAAAVPGSGGGAGGAAGGGGRGAGGR